MELTVGVLVFLVAIFEGVPCDARILFSCSFAGGTCGMENQRGVAAQWRRTFLRLGGRDGYAVAVTGNEANNHFARFLTPEFDTGGARVGCLTFLYFIDGLSPASLACIKQGWVTEYVFANGSKTQDHWERAKVDVEFMGDKVMFYFEANTRVQEYGNSIVAFTQVKITDSPCRRRSSKLGRGRTQ